MGSNVRTTLFIRIACLLLFLGAVSCVPASISRIGPPRAPRKTDCDIEVLAPGQSPSRPWVDIGAILVENCQEYHVGMCRKWIVQKACELGGEIAYLPNPESPRNETTNINYRVLVAVYASDEPSKIGPKPGGCAEPKPEPGPKADENEQRCTE
jgi:hypothetical protein